MMKTKPIKKGNKFLCKGAFIFLLCFFMSSMVSAGQILNLGFNDSKILDVFVKIERATKLKFIYNNEDIDKSKRINLAVQQRDMVDLLWEITAQSNLNFKVVDGIIAVSAQHLAEEITGKVTDSKGLPLPGATLKIKGANTATTTDANGNFKLKAEAGAVLMVSFTGYVTQEVLLGAEHSLVIVLKENSNTLQELTITALGIKKVRKSLTYAAAELKGDELTNVRDANLVNTVAGKVSGVVINKGAGGSGGTSKVVIRGNSSFSGNQPLYVIDGVPLYNATTTQANSVFGGGRDGGDAVSLLNPDDYDGMTILKGAAATALYGSQGANGVILLSSKKAKAGQKSISLSSSINVETASSLPQFQTNYGAVKDAEKSWGAAATLENHVPGFFKTGIIQSSSAGFSSGSEVALTSFNYANTNGRGIIEGNKINKHNFSLKETIKLFKDKFQVFAGGTYNTQRINNKPVNGFYFNPILGTYLMPRGNDFQYYKDNFEVFDVSRNLMVQNWPKNAITDKEQNPYWIINRNQTKDNNTFFEGNLGFNFKVTEWFTLASRYSYSDLTSIYEKKMYAGTAPTLARANGGYVLQNLKSIQNYVDVIASFNKQLGKDLNLTANLGASQLGITANNGTTFNAGNGLQYANWFTIGNFIDNAGNTQSTGVKKMLQSVFASATLGYKNFLYLDLTGRNDWSSTLANTDKNWFFYPSVGLTTIVSEMFKLPEFISYGKIRGSFAQVGKDIPAFVTSPTSTVVGGIIQNPNVGPRPGAVLKPEIKSEFEIGTEWRFVNDRLGIEASYYNSVSKNQYVEVPAPSTNPFGYVNYGFNAGSIQNKGLEIDLNAKAVKTEKFEWNLGLVFAKNISLVKEIPADLGGRINLTGSGPNSYRFALIQGRPFGIIEGYNIKRDNVGNIILNKDANSSIQKTGWEELGTPNPNFTLGFNNKIKYAQFYASFLIDGRFGGKVMSMTESMNDSYGVSKASGDARLAGGVNIKAIYSDGTPYTGLYPAESYYTQTGDRTGTSGEYIYDATNISLREFSLGYNFNLKSIPFIKSASASLVGRNLFFIHKKAPFDPNIALSTGDGFQGIDVMGLPTTRSFGINLNITF